jgi:archaeal flagellar protein FlaJ
VTLPPPSAKRPAASPPPPPPPVLPASEGPKPSPAAVPAKTEVVTVAPPPEPAKPAAPATKPNSALQAATEGLAVVVFLVLTLLPLARFGILRIEDEMQVNILIGASAILVGEIFLFRAAGYRLRSETADLAAARRRDDAILNALSVALAIVLVLIAMLELSAGLVFLQVLRSTGAVVIAVAGQFVLFATFTLLFLDLLLIARTSFDSRVRSKSWHQTFAVALLGISGLILLVALLKNLDVLNAGFFAQVRPEQSPYILSLATFLQLIAFRLLLRYPSLGNVFTNEIELARRANREQRVQIEKRALRAYFAGLAFVLLSFLLIGGVATGRIAQGDTRTSNVILVFYVIAGLGLLIVLVARFLQHRFLAQRAKRQEAGEVVARRRLTKEQIGSIFIYSLSGIFAVLCIVLSILTFLKRTAFRSDLGTDFLILAFIIGVGPYGFKRAVDMRRIRAMDDKFPDFLRDLAEGLRAGMTLPRALHSSSKGVYGALTPEIRHMSAQVEWGVSFSEALGRFAQRVKTPLIQRTVSLVNEAAKAGGNVVDILTAASTDALEIKQIIEDRRRQMGIYSVIIYVAFFVFLVVIFILAAQFLPSFQTAVKGAAGQQVGGLAFAPFKTTTYVSIFFHAALIQGIGGGLVAGVMTEGHPLGGLKHSFVMTIISWVFFRVLL